MISMAHEILVDLLKNRPALAAEILVEVLGVPLPAYTEARLASIDLTESQPAEVLDVAGELGGGSRGEAEGELGAAGEHNPIAADVEQRLVGSISRQNPPI